MLPVVQVRDDLRQLVDERLEAAFDLAEVSKFEVNFFMYNV